MTSELTGAERYLASRMDDSDYREAYEAAMEGIKAEETPKYCVHPGWVRSINDGDRHYIPARELMRLYGVDRRSCIVDNPGVHLEGMGFICLFPQPSGDYTLPERNTAVLRDDTSTEEP